MTEEMSAAERAGRELARGWPPLPPEAIERAARTIAESTTTATAPAATESTTPVPRITLTATEAAEACGVARDTIMRAIRSGRLKAKRSGEGGGGKYLITVAALEAWVAGMPDA